MIPVLDREVVQDRIGMALRILLILTILSIYKKIIKPSSSSREAGGQKTDREKKMANPIKDLRGQIFGRLTAMEHVGFCGSNATWLCHCACGNAKIVSQGKLKQRHVRSCGCLRKETTTKHGATINGKRTYEYIRWVNMTRRCRNKLGDRWEKYGGKGITVVDRWRDSFENFLADMGVAPSRKHTIDRIDVDGNYCKENCRWALPELQAVNKSIRKDNTSGGVGISWKRDNFKWQVQVSGKYLGVFESFEEAKKVRDEAFRARLERLTS